MSEISILYVEDEDTDVMLLQHVFTRVGITNLLKTVKDGKEAKDYLAGNPPYNDRQLYPLPGLLLLDLNLPYWSGLEVLGWLREQRRLSWMPVVIFTSSRRPDDVVKAYEAGANGYLVKPNSLADLTTMVQSLRDFWLLQNILPDSVITERARISAVA